MATLQKIILSLTMLFFAGCSTMSLVKSEQKLEQTDGVSLFQLQNYTDTPRAGMRSANIVEGILMAKGFRVKSHISQNATTFAQAQKIAKRDNSESFIIGGVSEWRYKTGIDGEPAVSLQLTMYNTKSGAIEWSATGADSDWGTDSIGTTAQKLLQTMMQ